jgi:radical SAM-linked protein
MQTRYKYRIQFSKEGAMRFVGHLDLLRLFQRSIKRSALPVAYSAGFNPHQLVSFAMPLPIGHSSAAEYVDVEFERELSDIGSSIKMLSVQLPAGLRVIKMHPLREGERAAAALAASAMYEIEFPGKIDIKRRAEEIMSAGSIIVLKKTKSGTADADIRPDVISLRADGNTLHAMLASGSARNLKPELLVKHIYGETEYNPFAVKYRRTEIFQSAYGGYEPLISS